MKGSLVILAFFIAGLIAGRAELLPVLSNASAVSFGILCALIATVGFCIGNDREIITKFRQLNKGLIFLPVAAAIGTFAGSLVAAAVLRHHTTAEWLAVGSGFGYYSLSSVLIGQDKGAELGTIALISNVVREMITLLCAPLLVRFFGIYSPIASGGATAIDTTLPIITKTCGSEIAPVSIYTGFVMDFSVPFLVTFFCSI